MALIEIVDSATVERRIASLDDAWAALVNATHADKAAVREAHAWVTWRREREQSSAFSQWLTTTAAMGELDAWQARYTDSYNAAGKPSGAPNPQAAGLSGGSTSALAWLAIGAAAAVALVALKGKG